MNYQGPPWAITEVVPDVIREVFQGYPVGVARPVRINAESGHDPRQTGLMKRQSNPPFDYRDLRSHDLQALSPFWFKQDGGALFIELAI
jgi:hypothetical protein